MMRYPKLSIVFGFGLLLLVGPARAQTPPSQVPKAPVNGVLPAAGDPDWQEYTVSDYLDGIQVIEGRKTEYETAIKNLIYFDSVKTDFEDLQAQLDEAQKLFATKRLVSSWDMIRAGDFKNDQMPLFQLAEKLKNNYSAYLAKTEKMTVELGTTLTTLKNFYELVQKDESLASHKTTIVSTKKYVDDWISQVRSGRKDYTAIYQENKDLLDAVTAFHESLDSEISEFRKARFQKTSPAVFEAAFYTGFTDDLLSELRLAWSDIFAITWEDIFSNRLEFLQALLLGWLTWLILLELRRVVSVAAKAEGGSLAIILRRPWVSTVLMALFFGAWRIERPPLLFVLVYWLALASIAMGLLIQLVKDRYGRLDIAILTMAYTALQIVEHVGVPLVLYRLFLAILAVLLASYCLHRIRIMPIISPVPVRVRQLMLRAMALLFLVTVLSEFLGYHLLAAFLLHAAVKTSFVVFVVWNLRELLRRVITGMLDASTPSRFAFLRKYRDLTLSRGRWFMDAALGLLITVMMLTLWGVYPDFSTAWEKMMGLGFPLFGSKLNLGLILQAVAIFVAVRILAFVVCGVLTENIYPRQRISDGSGKSINSLVTYLLWLVGALLAFSILGFDFRQLALIAGALSVGIGFGLQNIVNNFVAGLILLFERPIRIGDFLDIGGQLGTVQRVGLRSTVIRTILESELIIPNSDLITQPVNNLTFSSSAYIVVINVGVAYGTDPERVREVLLAAATGNRDIVQGPPPLVLFVKLGESAMEFELRARVIDASQKSQIYSDLLFAVYGGLRTAGIEIPFPQRVLHLESVSQQAAQVMVPGRV